MSSILVHDSDGTCLVRLNRPEQLNAITTAMVAEIREAVEDAERDPAVRVLVFSGEGGNFCSGADARELGALRGAAEARSWARAAQAMLDVIEACPKPSIAAIRGYCVAGGLELALACDLRMTAVTAQMGQTELLVGSIASWGGMQRLARTVGVARAKDLIFSARIVRAVEASEIGLVHSVHDADDLEAAVNTMCERLKSRPPIALAESKASLNRALDQSLHENLALDAAVFGRLAEKSELREGVAAFLEKRASHFEIGS